MSSAYTLVEAPLPGNEVLVRGTANQIVLGNRIIRRAQAGYETVETWGATDITSAKAFVTDIMQDERCADCEIEQTPPDITIRVRWAYDRTDTQWSVQSTETTWQLSFQQASKPLAFHPYFTSASPSVYIDMATADHAIATGQPPSNGGGNLEWMKRYNGLRLAGVDDWSPLAVTLVRTTRVFKSLPAATWKAFYQNINRTFTTAQLPTLPIEIAAALTGLEVPTYTALNPATDPSGVSQTRLLWVKQPPQFSMVGKNTNGPREITETYLGFDNVSAVIYPAAKVTNAIAGTWDPIYTEP